MCLGLRAIQQSITTYAGQFDARTLTAAQSSEVVGLCAQIEASAASIKALAAARSADADIWRHAGYRSASEQLADQAGMSPAAAKRALETGRRLAEQPEVAAAALAGELSLEQATAISDAVAADPAKAAELIDKAKRSSLPELNEEVARVKAARCDQEQRRRDRHAKRSIRRWTDRDGAFQAHLYGQPEDGVSLWRMLDPIRRRLNMMRRDSGAGSESLDALDYDAVMTMAAVATGKEAELGLAELVELGLFPQFDASMLAGRAAAPLLLAGPAAAPPPLAGPAAAPPPTPAADPELFAQFDASMLAGPAAATPQTPAADPEPFAQLDASRVAGLAAPPPMPAGRAAATPMLAGRAAAPPPAPAADPELFSAVEVVDAAHGDQAVTAAPPATKQARRAKKLAGSPIRVMVRVDLDALLRGVALDGELCEIPGYGPVPVSVVEDLLSTENPFIIGILTKAEALIGVYHHGRHPNAYQRSALDFLSPTCTVEGCCSRDALQYDHRLDYAKTHFTAFDLLDHLCRHHHRMKTQYGWALVEGRGKRAFVAPSDPRHPRFSPDGL